MREADEVKQAVWKAIDDHGEEIEAIAREVWRHPETGFREVRTAALAAKTLRDLGLEVREGIAMTGLRADLDSPRPGPKVAILGEMDSLLIPEAKECDPVTGAYHGCGHHTHIASMLGAAIGLTVAGARDDLSGSVVFMGTPAEEGIENAFRRDLMKQGKIRALSGKPAMIREGAFDDIDLSMMIHVGESYQASDGAAILQKEVEFFGRSGHAACPQDGVNAMNAATLAIQALGLQRETFRFDPDALVHGIITHAGTAVNVIPERAGLSYMIRSYSADCLKRLSGIFDRAMRGAAMAIGTEVTIETTPSCHAMRNNRALYDLYLAQVGAVTGRAPTPYIAHSPGSTDMGDVSAIMPALHGNAPGGVGGAHTPAFQVPDPRGTCTAMAKYLAGMAVDLLHGDAELGRTIAADRSGCLSIADYLQETDGLAG